LTIAAVPLSLYKLGSAPVWSDEAASVSISVQHGSALWSAVASDGGSMSAYYLLLHGLFLAGMGQSAISLRLVSAVALIATVPFLYAVMLRCFGAWVAFVATALVITNRTVISRAQEARGYELGLFLVVVAVWILVSAVDRPSGFRWSAWVVSSALACCCLLLSPLFAAAQLMSLGTLRRMARILRAAAIATGLLAVLLVPLALMALHRGTAQINWIPPLSRQSVMRVLTGIAVPGFPFWVRWPTVAAIALGMLSATFEARRSEPGSLERWRRVLLLCWAVIPVVAVVLVSFRVSLLESYYLIASIPAFAALAALGMASAASLLARGTARVASGLRLGERAGAGRSASARSAALGVVAAVVIVVPLVQTWRVHGAVVENGRRSTALVVRLARPGDGIIFDQPPQRMIFDYYLFANFHSARSFPLLPAPIWPSDRWGTQFPYAADHRVPAPSAVSALDARFERIWVVDGGWSHRIPRYVRQSRELLVALAHAYPVVAEADFRGVSVLVFSRSGPVPPGMYALSGGR